MLVFDRRPSLTGDPSLGDPEPSRRGLLVYKRTGIYNVSTVRACSPLSPVYKPLPESPALYFGTRTECTPLLSSIWH